jgi:hypothetical protein
MFVISLRIYIDIKKHTGYISILKSIIREYFLSEKNQGIANEGKNQGNWI